MQSHQTPNQPPARKHPDAPKPPAPRPRTMSRRTRLILIAAGSVVGVTLLVLLAVNLLISADWVRERVAFSPEWTPSGPRATDIHHEQSE